MKKIVLLSALLVLNFSCHNKEAVTEAATEAVAVSDNVAVAVQESPELKDKKMASQPNEEKEKAVDIASKIIKTADLRYETADLPTTYNQIFSEAKKQRAIIQNDIENKSDYTISRSLTIRVPNENFDAFITKISSGVTFFDRKEISSEDVTAEYIDTEARISAKKKLEIRYLELLKKAEKVQEMLEIEKQLSEIREEIEAKEGQLRYLKSKVVMSTINIEFYKNLAENSGARVSFATKIWNALVSGFNLIANFFINLVQLWPFISILVAIIYFSRKRIQKKKQS